MHYTHDIYCVTVTDENRGHIHTNIDDEKPPGPLQVMAIMYRKNTTLKVYLKHYETHTRNSDMLLCVLYILMAY